MLTMHSEDRYIFKAIKVGEVQQEDRGNKRGP
jgi:hypothetical protein